MADVQADVIIGFGDLVAACFGAGPKHQPATIPYDPAVLEAIQSGGKAIH